MDFRFPAMVLVLALCVGCGGESRLPTVKVVGKLTVDGKPLGPAGLTFQPNPLNPKRPSSSGTVDQSGTFLTRTYAEADGLPEGAYDVTLLPDMMSFTPVPQVAPCKVEVKAGNSELVVAMKSTGKGTQLNEMPTNSNTSATTTPIK